MEVDNNNDNNDDNTHERNTHSGNMYSYRDDSIQEPPKESNAIRRSIGIGINQNAKPPYSQDYSRSNPKYLDQFPYSFDKNRKKKNPFGQSSEIRLNQPENNLFKKPNITYRKRPVQKNYYYLITYITIAILHCILIMLIGLLYDFDIGKSDEEITKYYHLFTFFKDMNIFIFIGFGFLLSFLRDHQWSSILLVLFLGSVAIEFSFFGYYLWVNSFTTEISWEKINLDYYSLIRIEYFTASAIVSLSSLIGKLSLIQYFIIIILEIFFCSLNYFLCHEKLYMVDNGGSVIIYMFGAIFGLSASSVLFCQESEFMRINNNQHYVSNYYSNIFSFIGSIFLWLFFPSFNTADIINQGSYKFYELQLGFISENLRYRGIINTYLSMIGSMLCAFTISPLLYNGKLKINHLLNASYVGGVVIAGCCTICSNAWAAILIGFGGSAISILFLWRIKNLLHSIRFEDSLGTLQLFGIPGLIGGIMTCIFVGNMNNQTYWNESATAKIFGGRKKPLVLAGLEIASVFVTLGIAIISGIVTGVLARVMICSRIENYYVDSELFVGEEEIIFPEYLCQDDKDNLSSSGNNL